MGNPVAVTIELKTIESFFDRVLLTVDDEYKRLSQQSETGAFETSDDMDAEANAFFFPMTSEEIALRAVLLELNALVEWELRELLGFPKNTRKDGSLQDISRGQLGEYFLQEFKVSLAEMPGFDSVERIRNISNAAKHRKGFKIPGRDCALNSTLSRWSLERAEVRLCIAGVKQFLTATMNKQKGLNSKG